MSAVAAVVAEKQISGLRNAIAAPPFFCSGPHKKSFALFLLLHLFVSVSSPFTSPFLLVCVLSLFLCLNNYFPYEDHPNVHTNLSDISILLRTLGPNGTHIHTHMVTH